MHDEETVFLGGKKFETGRDSSENMGKGEDFALFQTKSIEVLSTSGDKDADME